ncbi:MAG: hypothetical protein ACOY93_10680 [Bacillota bacterium]
MRLNDRVIKESLRKQAMSVPVPEDMWANISRELDKDAARERPPVSSRAASQRMQARQMLAVAAAAGIFWMMIIPSGAYMDSLQQPGPVPVAAIPAAGAQSETPWEMSAEPVRSSSFSPPTPAPASISQQIAQPVTSQPQTATVRPAKASAPQAPAPKAQATTAQSTNPPAPRPKASRPSADWTAVDFTRSGLVEIR